MSTMGRMTDKVTSFGQMIRELREERGQSLREVSGKMGIDMSLLGKLERNERQPTKEQIKLIASFYRTDEKELVKELLADQFAARIIEAELGLDTLKLAEGKVEYLKKHK